MYNVRFLASFILLLLGSLLRLSYVLFFFRWNREESIVCAWFFFLSLFFCYSFNFGFLSYWWMLLVLDWYWIVAFHLFIHHTHIFAFTLLVLHCFCDLMLSLFHCGCGSLYFFISRNCLPLYNHSLSPIWRATLAGTITLKVILNVSHNAHTCNKTTVVHSISERAKKNAFAWFAL